jgi:uncharacterized UBP type Zn finger protein
MQCTHLDTIQYDLPAKIEGCEDCLKSGDSWVHLRLCTSCGHIGCCDSSKNRHATKHFRQTQHPILRSAERGEEWFWCNVDNVMFE